MDNDELNKFKWLDSDAVAPKSNKLSSDAYQTKQITNKLLDYLDF